jgi:hypothetical protein
MDLPLPILAYPERAFRPREPRVAAAAGRGDRGQYPAALRIDLLDAILGDLKEVPAVKGRSRVRGDVDRAQRLPARRVQGVQLVSGRKPNLLAGNGPYSRRIFAADRFMFWSLAARQRSGE